MNHRESKEDSISQRWFGSLLDVHLRCLARTKRLLVAFDFFLFCPFCARFCLLLVYCDHYATRLPKSLTEEKSLGHKEMMEASEYWDSVSDNYVKFFAPNFQAMHLALSEEILKEGKTCDTVLDFACGPGQPSRTLLSLCNERLYKNASSDKDSDCPLKRLIAMDVSPDMVRLASSSAKVPKGIAFEAITLTDQSSISSLGPLDVIVCSFGLMYLDKETGELSDTLGQFHDALTLKGGRLIGSVWAHPSVVPFLRIFKLVNSHMNKEAPNSATLESLETTDGSFSFWDPLRVGKLLAASKFELIEWREIDMPMTYNAPEELLSFSSDAEWFKDPKERAVAIEYTRRLVAQELGKEPDGQFTLQNKGILFVAIPR